MRFKTLLSALFLLPALAFADTVQSQGFGPFGGLNTNQSAESLGSSQSPDLLNVDVSNGGTSVKKRQGYGLDATLTISTSAVHNLYKFFDASGNQVRLAFNDNRINASVNGGAWSVIIATGVAIGSTWDCTDYLGFAYCVSSAFDCPIKTNGTTAGTTGVCGTNFVPQGTLVSNTGDRLLVGATSANPSRLYYSASTVFTDFALGTQPSSSSFEDITAPGSKLTHLAYRFGRWLWWKDQSFGFLVGTGQFDLNTVIVSNTIGTLDNTDVFDGNYLYFRGSDAQIYTYDGANLSRSISSDIGPSLLGASSRKANSWAQSSQSDFQTGSIVPTGQLSTTISAGDVIVSSFSGTDTALADFSQGTGSNITFESGDIIISTDAANISNNGFESGDLSNWTNSGSINWVAAASFTGDHCSASPQTGSWLAQTNGDGNSGVALTASVIDANTGASYGSTVVSFVSNSCTWTQRTITVSATALRKRVNIKFSASGNSTAILTSDSFISNSANVTFYTASDSIDPPGVAPIAYFFLIDTIAGTPKSSITTGTFASRVFDTGFTSSTAQLQASWTVNSATPYMELQHAVSSGGPFKLVLTSTATNAVVNRYLRYISTITVTSNGNAATTLNDATVLTRSTGTYYSAVNNATLLTSWGTLNIDDTPGNSPITYYVRASTGSFTVLSSTPNWIAQTKNATVNYSTGTYMQLRADFTITAATETPTLNDFTFNWFEGSSSDKMYATYFKNAIWFAISNGTTSTNNRIFRYDLLANLWTLYDIASNGFLTYNNDLYFGDPSAGKIYRFGNNVYSDNSAAISAYWKSKPFFGDSPFTEKDLRMGSWYVASDSGTTLTVTYTLDQTTTTVTKNINLYDSRRGTIRNNYNFPAGTSATVFSAKVSDNSSNVPWEVFGGLVTFVPRPIIVTP